MAPSTDRVTPKHREDAAMVELVQYLSPRIAALVAHWESNASAVEVGSSLSGDDRRTKPSQISHAAWHHLGVAIDSLHALQTLTVREGADTVTIATHPYAGYPLLRTAFENASACLWLLGPKDRQTRVLRRLRLLYADARNLDNVEVLSGTGKGDVEARRWASTEHIRDAYGFSNRQSTADVRYREIVRDAATAVGGEADHAEVLWRALSGLSHGDFWASLASTDREEVAVRAGGDVVTLRVSSSIANIAGLTHVAVGVVTAALTLFDTRRINQVDVVFANQNTPASNHPLGVRSHPRAAVYLPAVAHTLAQVKSAQEVHSHHDDPV